MIFHASMDADDPQRVAQALAELWGGLAVPFPPVIAGSWQALSGDERNTAMEIYPRGTRLTRAEGDADAYGVQDATDHRSSAHFAVATRLDADQVTAIAAREGWPIKYRKRGGAFGVLELWIEGRQMIEVLTPEMQAEYLAAATIENWQKMLAARRAAA